ncbi:MAG: type II toxin-antitoxin system RelE/ParE family toxin [Flavobacterium sp.]
MGLVVYWTQFAEDKLQDIFNYYNLKAGPGVATRLTDGIVDASLDLDHRAYSGQREELLIERLQEFRYILYKNYKIIYWVDTPNNMILIANVFDTRQNPDKITLTP